jgi:aspartyl-tRNA(Asn)/glutamyl-tRNA(Gln) amidotransferase subunit B
LPASDAGTLKSDIALGNYFESIGKQAKSPKAVANWVINNLRAKLAEGGSQREGSPTEKSEVRSPNSEVDQRLLTPGATEMTLANLRFKPDAILELVGLVENKTISSSAAQQVFAEMFDTGKAPAAIVQEKGLAQVSDTGAIEKYCDEAIAANPGPANDFRSGKIGALNFLKGQVMKLSKGKANPVLVGEVLEQKLKS